MFLEKNIWVIKNGIQDIYQEIFSLIRVVIQNVIIGKLCDEHINPILLNCENLKKPNYQPIPKLFNDLMSLLWPNSINVLLFVSDAASYMMKARKTLNTFIQS